MVVKSEAGMTMLGMLCVVMLVAGSMLVVMKVAPVYVDDYAIAKALKAVGEESGIGYSNKREIRKILTKRLSVDYTRELADDEIKVIKSGKELRIEISYEARVPLVYNLDVVARFEHLHVESL